MANRPTRPPSCRLAGSRRPAVIVASTGHEALCPREAILRRPRVHRPIIGPFVGPRSGRRGSGGSRSWLQGARSPGPQPEQRGPRSPMSSRVRQSGRRIPIKTAVSAGHRSEARPRVPRTRLAWRSSWRSSMSVLWGCIWRLEWSRRKATQGTIDRWLRVSLRVSHIT